MVKSILMLIPPMGHDSEFYSLLNENLLQAHGDSIDLLTPDYPEFENLTELSANEILDYLANYFLQLLNNHQKNQSGPVDTFIGGVSLGATLSIRINHLMQNADQTPPKRVFLLASGGLKVSRARRETIEMAMNKFSPAEFVLKSMAIDGETFQESSFPVQFQQSNRSIEQYWHHQAAMLKQVVSDPVRAANFLKLTQAALGVDYEHHMEAESSNYSILWSEQDKVFSKRMYRKFQRFAHQARFHLMSGIGHYAPLEDPPRIAQIINQDMQL